jgi:hypothetical protein
MSESRNHHDAGSQRASSPPSAVKKRYAKPDFKHEKVFETMALACGKLSATQAQCRFNRKLS